MPESEVVSRLYGGVPEPVDKEPLVPMLFLQDSRGEQSLLTTIRE